MLSLISFFEYTPRIQFRLEIKDYKQRAVMLPSFNVSRTLSRGLGMEVKREMLSPAVVVISLPEIFPFILYLYFFNFRLFFEKTSSVIIQPFNPGKTVIFPIRWRDEDGCYPQLAGLADGEYRKSITINFSPLTLLLLLLYKRLRDLHNILAGG